MTDTKQTIYFLGYASGLSGADPLCGQGPQAIQTSSYLAALEKQGYHFSWEMFHPKSQTASEETISELCQRLAKQTSSLLSQGKSFYVLGGDHTCAIGTWSGIFDALHIKGDIGLIWIDAHMDSHTPETSFSQRLHGMPLACLLGEGFPKLKNLLQAQPKLKPENLCIIGVRSFEPGEAALLKRLNVKVYDMEEVTTRGFLPVLQEAQALVSKNTVGYGLSLDLDGIDPTDAPGVDVPEPNGLSAAEVLKGLELLGRDKKFITAEIVEFDPARDKDQMTERLVVDCLRTLITLKG